ncbi:MAG: hypothetical protein ACXIUM_13570 [Wenzhouxiangella sp.]
MAPAWAQQPSTPQLDFWAAGSVLDASASSADGVYAVGSFSLANGTPAFSAVRILADGSLDAGFRPEISGSVFSVQGLNDGGVILGGGFTQVNGVSRDRLVRLGSDGTVVSSWSAQINDTVLSLHAADDSLYVGGLFTQVNGAVRTALARLSLATGALDNGFAPTISGSVLDVAVDGAGRVWVGGSFSSVNGESARNLVVLAADGTLIRTFVVDGVVRSLSFDPEGRIYACGDFDAVDGEQRRSAARFLLDPAPELDGWAIETDGRLFRCLADQDGVWIAGDMSVVNGLDRAGAARVSFDGVVAEGFAPLLGGVYVGNPHSEARATALVALDSERLLIGGLFSLADSQPLAGLAILNRGTGSLVSGYALEARAEIRSAIARLDDESLLIGGSFRRVGAVIVNNLALLRPNGSIDPDWPISANGQVLVANTLADGSIILGGFFSRLGTESRLSLARLENPVAGVLDQDWRPEVRGSVHALHADACSPHFLYVGGSFSLGSGAGGPASVNFAKFDLSGTGSPLPFNVGFDGQVNAIAQTGCESLLVAGLFNQAQGLARRGLARVSTQAGGSTDPSFNAGANGVAWSLLRDPQSGAVYIGGEFTQLFGQSRRRIAKWDGGLSDWNPGTNGVPVAMVLDGLGAIYTVGTFFEFGGVQRARIAKVSTQSPAVVDGTFNPGSDGPVLWGARILGEELYVSGNFTVAGGLSRRALAIFDIDVLRPDPIFADRFAQGDRDSSTRTGHATVADCAEAFGVLYGPLESDQPFARPPCTVH